MIAPTQECYLKLVKQMMESTR
jgi:hypothetical protein